MPRPGGMIDRCLGEEDQRRKGKCCWKCSHLFDLLVVLVALVHFFLLWWCILGCPLQHAEGKTDSADCSR